MIVATALVVFLLVVAILTLIFTAKALFWALKLLFKIVGFVIIGCLIVLFFFSIF